MIINYRDQEVIKGKKSTFLAGATPRGINVVSWRIMEKLGFERLNRICMVQYTFIDELLEDFEYVLTK